MTTKWQAFLQQIVLLISKGYFFYHKTEYPVTKMHKWEIIDEKLIKKYDANRDRFRVYRRKKKGEASFKVLRWYDQCVILHNEGVRPATDDPDKFIDIMITPLNIRVSSLLSFNVSLVKGHVQVILAEDTYDSIRDNLGMMCRDKLIDNRTVVETFARLNGIPPYKGVNLQKYRLKEFVFKEFRRHQRKISKSDLRIRTKRKLYRFYEKAPAT